MGSVWSAWPFHICVGGDSITMWRWLACLHQQLGNEEFYLAIIIAWKAWDSRNREMHGEKSMSASEMRNWSRSYLNAYRQAQLARVPGAKQQYVQTFRPPPEGRIKINFDAALPQGQDRYMVAAIARDSSGQCVGWRFRSFTGKILPVEGEACAAKEATILARMHGWRSVIIEGDNLQIIKTLNDGDLSLYSFGLYLEDVLDFATSIDFCKFHFLGNKLAHMLASLGTNHCIEGNSLPPELASFAPLLLVQEQQRPVQSSKKAIRSTTFTSSWTQYEYWKC